MKQSQRKTLKSMHKILFTMESEDKQVGSSKPKEKWIQNNREKEKGKKRGKKNNR